MERERGLTHRQTMTHPKANTQQILLTNKETAPVFRNETRISKVEKYSWPCRNEPGEFAMISKHELHIAGEYQRKALERAVMSIAREWNWIACGVLIVVERDGKWWVVDGQHRKLAADKRSDIQELPCMVFQGTSVQSEAKTFLEVNTHRYTVSSFSKYRAGLTSGDPVCKFLDSVLSESNLSVGLSGSAKTVACISTLLALAKDDKDKFIKLWPLITHMHTDSEIFGDVTKGLWAVEEFWSKTTNSKTITKDPAYSKLIRVGGKACNQEIKRLSIERGKGGEAVFRDAILGILRKKI